MNAGLTQDIKAAVERASAMSAMHKRSVPVVETIRGDVVWQGMVEVFALSGDHPSTAYGWAVNHKGKNEYVAVLGVPPINSAFDAVRAWVVSTTKK